jgi:hypothetical protein
MVTPKTRREKRKHAIVVHVHLVGASEECGRDIEAERFGGLEVHHQFELGRLFDRQVGGLRTLIGRTGTGNSM